VEVALRHRVIMVLPALASAPEQIRVEAQTRFDQIADALEGIRPDNAFWSSVRTSRLCLVVRGWSFFYELDDGTLRVTGVRRGPWPG
jgi:hypothetical protein